MKGNSLLIIVVIVALVAAAVQLPHSGAYFSDVQTATVTIRTGVWSTEADSLVVNKDKVKLVGSVYGPRTRLHGMKIGNGGEYNITIDKIVVSWTPEGGYIRVINIWFWGEVEWTGEVPSGSILDIEDLTLSPGERHNIDFTFDVDMSGKVFTIEFIMSDGSTLIDPFGPVGIADEEPTPTPQPTPKLFHNPASE